MIERDFELLRALSELVRTSGSEWVEARDAEAAATEAGIGGDDFMESLDVLRHRRLADVETGINGNPLAVEITPVGFDVYALRFIDDYEPTLQGAARWLFDHGDDYPSNKQMAEAIHADMMLANHIIRVFASRDWLRYGSMDMSGEMPVYDVQSYYAAKLDAGLSPTTVRKHHNVLHAALRHAVRLQLLAVNPADSVVPPRIVRKEMHFLDAGQSAAMLRAAAGTRLYMPLLLALGTGMRRGELLGLRWSDVDLDGGTLIVTQTVQEAFGQLHIKEPKTAKSQRRITLPALVVDALRAYRTEQAKETLASPPGEAESGLVLRAPDGGPWWPSNFNRTWQRFKGREALAIRFHDLRHSHASQLLTAGVHVKVVSERLGHASVGITLDTYSHVIPALQEEAAEKIDAGLRAALAG